VPTIEECISLIQQQFNITPEKAKEVIDQVQSERFRIEAQGTQDGIDRDMAKFISENADQSKIDALNRKRLKVQDLKSIASTIENMDERLKANPKMDIMETLEAEMAGKPQLAKSHDSIELHAETKSRIGMANLQSDLDSSKLQSKLLQNEEFFETTTKILLGKKTDDIMATQAAEIFRKHSDILYLEKKKWRPDIGYIKDHVPQIWYPSKMASYSADEFANDLARTSNITDTQVGKEIYTKIIDGHSIEDFLPEIIMGSGVTGERMVKSRVIHIPDSDNWFSIAKKYGDENGISSMAKSISRDYYTLGIIERTGVRPQQNLIRAAKAIVIKNPDRAKRDRLLDNIDGNKFRQGTALWRLWRNVDRTVLNPYNPGGIVYKLAQVESWRQNTSKLGGAQLSALTDPFLGAMQMQFRGKSLLKAYGDNLSQLFTRAAKGPDGMKKVAEYAGVYADSSISDTIYRYGPMADDLPGKLGRLQDKFFKWTGLTPWTDHMRTNSTAILSYELAKKTRGGWSQLDSRFVKMLDQYKINQEQFSKISKFLIKDKNGRSFVDVSSMSDPEMRMNFNKMFIDEANKAVIAPKAAEMAWVNWGFPAGSGIGTIFRLAMKFKTFPLSFGRQVMIPALREGAQGNIGYLAHMLVGSTAFGYIAMSAKDIERGSTPRPLDRWENFIAAMIQGGGMGIYGDFLLQDYTRYGDSPMDVLMGPTAGDISTVTKWGSGLIHGKVPSLKEVLREGIGATPFANIWYTKSAMNYLFLHGIYQDLDPAYMGRMKKRLNERGQEQFLEPITD